MLFSKTPEGISQRNVCANKVGAYVLIGGLISPLEGFKIHTDELTLSSAIEGRREVLKK